MIYIVHYGDYTSEYKSCNFQHASNYILYCIRNGIKVRGVEQEKRAAYVEQLTTRRGS